MAKDRQDQRPLGLGFEETQTAFESASQNARVWTEAWVSRWLYCPNCGNENVEQFENNRPAADFLCKKCNEQYELKSKKGRFGSKVVDGAYESLRTRLGSEANPNFAFLSYDLQLRSVRNLFVVPKQFFVPDILEERRPLPPTARRAGWVGCNIKLNQVPSVGKIFIVRDGQPEPKELVFELWQKTLFLREETPDARGWLLEVMGCCEAIGRSEFSLDEVYAFERRLAALYPENRHVRQKIRQQLQVLRDKGFLDFVSRGRYRMK